MSKTKVEQIVNNVVYVEPNYTNSVEEFDVNGLNTYEFTPPLEDYSIYINLEVEIRGRNIQSTKTSGNKKIIMSYISTPDGISNVNFMQGSKIPIGENGATMNSLTTNYTDIFIKDLKKTGASTEVFGISSIDIAYNAYAVPEVTIEFIDVRGAALFAQRELHDSANLDKAINSNNESDIANTFFQCFFSQPYPKYTLLVKGFYGQPVSYVLTYQDFRARFDSSTGNFACTAKFVGYQFAFLNDVMSNGLVAAPYSDYIGSEYWENRKFKIKGTEGGDINMPKLGWILKKMKDIEATADKMSQSDPSVQEKAELDNKKELFNSVETAYNNFVDAIEGLIPDVEYNGESVFSAVRSDNGKIKSCIILSPTSNDKSYVEYVNDEKSGQLSGLCEALEYSINEYNEKYPNEKLPTPNKFYDLPPTQAVCGWPNDNLKACPYKPFGNVVINKYPNLYNLFKIKINNGNKDGKINPLLEYKQGYFYYDNGFCETLEKYKKENGEKTIDVEKRIESVRDSLISKVLKFHPTVENMTKILMAHFETFVYMIFKTAKDICDEKPPRTIKSLHIGDSRSINDVPKEFSTVPPFPNVTTEVRRDGSTIREETWVGNYKGHFKEKDLVHGLINGINEIAKDAAIYEGEIVGASGEAGSDSPTKAMQRFPLSPIDMSAKDKPYISGGYDENDASSLLGLAGLRAMQIFGLTNFSDWSSNAEIIGIAEAYNFLDCNKVNKEMRNKLNGISPENAVDMMLGKETDAIQKPTNKPWPWNVDAKSNDGIISDNGYLKICYINNKQAHSVPYQNLSWNKLNKESLKCNNGAIAMFSNDYLNTKSQSNVNKPNLFTFDTNINRFSTIAEKQLKGIDGIENCQKTFTDECKYDSEKYSSLINNGNEIIAYIIENAANIVPSDNSCMLPTSSNAFSNKVVGRGYDMDKFSNENPGDGSDGWIDKNGNEVKRKSSSGFTKYLQEFNSRDFTFTEFPGVKPSLEAYVEKGDPAVSVFSQLLYYRQTSIRSRALLFLAGLGYVFDYKKIISEYICNDKSTMCIIPLPAIMFIGALLWSDKDENKQYLKGYNTNTNFDEFYYRESLIELRGLRDDVKRRFIEIFNKWITNGVEGDEFLESFETIKSGLELNFLRTDYEKFFSYLDELEEKKWYGGSNTGWLKKFNNGYTTLMGMFKGELGDSFFNNYITFDEDVFGNTLDGTKGMRLGNRDGGTSSVHACNFALAGCVFSKNIKNFKKASSTSVKVETDTLNSFFKGFIDTLKKEVKENDESVNDSQISQAKEPDNSNEDIKIGIYRYCKLIYDKWIAGISLEEFNKNWTFEEFFENKTRYFYFIDAFYNEMDFIPINIGDFCDKIINSYRNQQYSLLSLLSDIYYSNKFSFYCIQNFLDLGKVENMKTMFDTISYTEAWEVNRHPCFIVLYNYEASKYLADIDNQNFDNDGFMINEPDNNKTNIWPEALKSSNANLKTRYTIPAFGVSYGKMYQSYFKDIDISMESPVATEQTIRAQMAIAYDNNVGEQTGDRGKIFTFGQDLYSIYSNNSYTCNVTMMGCAWVQPLMYFVLNNIPMFRGTYLVQKVTHRIEQGNMITKFMGVRMSNVCTRIVRDEAIRARLNQTGEGEKNGEFVEIEQRLAGIDNNCPYKEYPIESDYAEFSGNESEKEKALALMNSLISMGFSNVAAAGIVGNMYEESYNPSTKTYFDNTNVIVDSNGYKSGGLCMWNATNLCDLVNNVKPGTNKDANCSKNITSSDMPSVKKQLEFLYADITTNYKKIPRYGKGKYPYFNQFVGKDFMDVMNNAPSSSDAAKYFAAVYERCSICMNGIPDDNKRVKKAKEYYNLLTSSRKDTKLANNNDGHVSDLAAGFVDAISKTSKSSSENVNIGYDSSKSSGDTVWLTNASNSKNFGAVFDMILSAYSSKVESVTWIVKDSNSYGLQPSALLVKVKEGSTVTKISVATEDNPNSALNGLRVPTDKNNKSDLNEYFCKSLRKKYKSNTEQLHQDTNNCIENYEDLFKETFSGQTCDEAMKDAGYGSTNNYGTGGVENETGFIGNWNVGEFVKKLHYYAANHCEIEHSKDKDKGIRDKPGGSCHLCTGAINRALSDSGLGMKYWGNKPWDVYNKMKRQDSDFVEIRSATNVPSESEFSLGALQKGDICVMWSSQKAKFHTCAYDGSGWYSDFVQNSCNVYRSGKHRIFEWHLFRHK